MPASQVVRPPSILRRLASMCYESLLLLAVLAVLLVLPQVLLGAFAHRLASPLLLQAHCFLVLLIYLRLVLERWAADPGDENMAHPAGHPCRDGLALRPTQALLRFLICWPSIVLGGAGILWALFDQGPTISA
jgi:hypothetical protein